MLAAVKSFQGRAFQDQGREVSYEMAICQLCCPSDEHLAISTAGDQTYTL